MESLLIEQKRFWLSIVSHTWYLACFVQLWLLKHCLNVKSVGTLEHFNICNEVIAAPFGNMAEIVLVEASEEEKKVDSMTAL